MLKYKKAIYKQKAVFVARHKAFKRSHVTALLSGLNDIKYSVAYRRSGCLALKDTDKPILLGGLVSGLNIMIPENASQKAVEFWLVPLNLKIIKEILDWPRH